MTIIMPRPRTRAMTPGMEAAERAADHADREHSPFFWSANALEHVRVYAETHPGPFMGEDVRQWATDEGFPSAPTHRAWGAVMARAKRMGYIRRVGAKMTENTNMRSHGTYSALWVSLICGEQIEPCCPTCFRPFDVTAGR